MGGQRRIALVKGVPYRESRRVKGGGAVPERSGKAER